MYHKAARCTLARLKKPPVQSACVHGTVGPPNTQRNHPEKLLSAAPKSRPPTTPPRMRASAGLDTLLSRVLPHERALHKRWTQHWIGSDLSGRPVVFESLGSVDPAAVVSSGISVDDMARHGVPPGCSLPGWTVASVGVFAAQNSASAVVRLSVLHWRQVLYYMKHQELARELMKEARSAATSGPLPLQPPSRHLQCVSAAPPCSHPVSVQARHAPPAQATRQQGKLVETVLHIVDVSGCSLKSHLSATARELFSRIANVSDLCYPETLGKLIIVNTSKARAVRFARCAALRSSYRGGQRVVSVLSNCRVA